MNTIQHSNPATHHDEPAQGDLFIANSSPRDIYMLVRTGDHSYGFVNLRSGGYWMEFQTTLSLAVDKASTHLSPMPKETHIHLTMR